jgi:hypothetical protein
LDAYKVKTKRMTKAKKNAQEQWIGSITLTARKVGCSPKYVSMVLRDALGKYKNRDTELVKRIRQVNKEVVNFINP